MESRVGHSLYVTFDQAAPRDTRNAAGRGSSVGKLKRFFKLFKLNHLPFNPASNLCDDHPAGRIVSSKKGRFGLQQKGGTAAGSPRERQRCQRLTIYGLFKNNINKSLTGAGNVIR